MASQLNGCDPSNLFVKAMNDVRVGGLNKISYKKEKIRRRETQETRGREIKQRKRKKKGKS